MPKKIINVSQNETGRYNYKDQPDIDLVTMNLQSCLAVIFTDTQGNVSLTHVDIKTDLSFIETEAKLMKGKFTVDIVKLKTNMDEFAEYKLLPFILKKIGADILNSKGTQAIRNTNTGLVLTRDGALLTPTLLDVEQISPNNADLRHKIPKSNPLKEDFLDNGKMSFQLRIYAQHLNMVLDHQQSMPAVIYDKGWTGKFVSLNAYPLDIVRAFKANFVTQEQLINKGLADQSMTLNNLTLAQKLPISIEKYITYCQELNIDPYQLINRRNIITITQNETGRTNTKTHPNIHLSTVNLQHCVAVILSDDEGKVSLTHVDVKSDLTFLAREAAWMGGKFKLDIIKLKTSTSALGQIIHYFVEQLFGKVLNSKGNNDIRNTSTGAVLTDNGKLLTPQRVHLAQISDMNLKPRLGQPLPMDNPYREDRVDDGAKHFDLRIYEAFANMQLEPKEVLPPIVYENGWTGHFATLTPTSKEILIKYQKGSFKKQDIVKHCKERCNKDKSDYESLELVEQTPAYLDRYLALCQKLNLPLQSASESLMDLPKVPRLS